MCIYVCSLIVSVASSADAVKAALLSLFDELLGHDGYGSLSVEMRLLKRGQKEVLLVCGKQHRYVVDFVAADSTSTRSEGAAAR